MGATFGGEVGVTGGEGGTAPPFYFKTTYINPLRYTQGKEEERERREPPKVQPMPSGDPDK